MPVNTPAAGGREKDTPTGSPAREPERDRPAGSPRDRDPPDPGPVADAGSRPPHRGNPPMPVSRRLLLVASDPRLAAAAQAHLQKALQLTTPAARFEDVPHLLTPETDGD